MTSMIQYVALLRGINVGGKNIIRMIDLKACFEGLGFEDVRTYIQSGNVIFKAGRTSQAKLEDQIEKALANVFEYPGLVVTRSHAQLEEIVARAPKGFGSKPHVYRYDVIFLKAPLNAAEAMKSVTTREGVDQAFSGKGVLYFSRLTSRASQSRLSRIAGMAVYQHMTIRNWNTTTKLLKMMEAGSETEPSRPR